MPRLECARVGAILPLANHLSSAACSRRVIDVLAHDASGRIASLQSFSGHTLTITSVRCGLGTFAVDPWVSLFSLKCVGAPCRAFGCPCVHDIRGSIVQHLGPA
jgi:hypothetical protein